MILTLRQLLDTITLLFKVTCLVLPQDVINAEIIATPCINQPHNKRLTIK